MTTDIELGIDHLTDISVVGRGGFSVVYAATHSLFKRRMAVKVLNTLTKDSERRRFERECEVMGRLSDHPNVVSVFNAGYTDDGKPYLLMELVEGGSLDGLLRKRGRLPWQEAVRYLIPIASALERAHRENILHRDVKPENILLDGDRPLLADFGIASLRDATGATSTHITASMAHTAPETFENRRDERSDQYSLGSTLHTLITGRPPFWREGDGSIHPMMHRLLNEPAPALPPGFGPPALAGLLQRSLAKQPDDRFPTVADLRAALEGLLHSSGSEPVAGGFTPPASSPFGADQPGHTGTSGWGTSGWGASAMVPPVVSQPVVSQPVNPYPFVGTGHPPVAWAGSGPVDSAGPSPADTAPRVVARSVDYGVWFVLWLVCLMSFPSGDGADGATSYVSILASSSLSTALIVLYETIMVGLTGATLGKLMLGLRVVTVGGAPSSYGTAFKRQWLNLGVGILTALAYVPLLVGFGLAVAALMMISSGTGLRQAPWDKLAGTMVIRR